ncbi:MAG: DNA repair protein RadC [Pseudomonadota bacterium]
MEKSHFSPTGPRDRILEDRGSMLTIQELLAIVLGTGGSGYSVYQLAARLLDEFESLDRLLVHPPDMLRAIPGMGPAKVARLKAVRELTLRAAEEQLLNGITFDDVGAVSRYIQRRIGQKRSEVFGCLFLDGRHRLLSWEVLFYGSVDKAHVHAREIVRRAFELNAGAIVFGHNHPSGVAEPSQADIALTKDLGDLLARMDIRLLDHIVVSRGSCVSMAMRGLMPAF